MLHFIRFWQPCLAAACFASCGQLVPTIRPSMTEWCHQVNISPATKTLASSTSRSLGCVVLLSVVSNRVSAQLTVSASPLAGMTMAPHLEGHEIAFNASDRKSWRKYARSIDEYLKCESRVTLYLELKSRGLSDKVVEFVQKEASTQWVNPHLHHLCPLFSIWFLQGMLGREASLLAVCSNSMQFFFHALLLSSFLNQRPEPGRDNSVARVYLCPPLSILSLCPPFAAYGDAVQERKNIRCTQDKYFMQEDLEESAERKACQFKRSWLGDCSGMQDPHYGYSRGSPCILLRMNRVRRHPLKLVKQGDLKCSSMSAHTTKEGTENKGDTVCCWTFEAHTASSKKWHLVEGEEHNYSNGLGWSPEGNFQSGVNSLCRGEIQKLSVVKFKLWEKKIKT